MNPLARTRRSSSSACVASIGLLVAAQIFAPPSVLAQHASTGKPSASATGPTVVHDPVYAKATVAVVSIPIPGSSLSIVVLDAANLPDAVRGKVLGAHVHSAACGTDPLASGGHHQNPDANPATPLGAREVWLDLGVDNTGRAVAIALVDWKLRRGQAGSVVVHALSTHPTTGAAGARVMCTTVPFND